MATVTVKKIAWAAWQFTTDGDAPRDWYRDGKIIEKARDEDTLILQTGDDNEPPIIEVVAADDVGYTPTQVLYPPYLALLWRGLTEAALYYAEIYLNAAWAIFGGQPESGAGYYRAETQPNLDDDTEYDLRVTPYDDNSDAGSAMEFTARMVRNPDPPSINMTYSAVTGDVTIAERT